MAPMSRMCQNLTVIDAASGLTARANVCENLVIRRSPLADAQLSDHVRPERECVLCYLQEGGVNC
jgi:hypothetical protein